MLRQRLWHFPQAACRSACLDSHDVDGRLILRALSLSAPWKSIDKFLQIFDRITTASRSVPSSAAHQAM
jgi:hypothetical protein